MYDFWIEEKRQKSVGESHHSHPLVLVPLSERAGWYGRIHLDSREVTSYTQLLIQSTAKSPRNCQKSAQNLPSVAENAIRIRFSRATLQSDRRDVSFLTVRRMHHVELNWLCKRRPNR